MLQQRTIGSLTELYVSGGGYLTQAAATEYRQVWKTKMLTPGETIDDYREATAAEVQKYLTPPAVVRPEQGLIDRAAVEGITFNEQTNLFSYNGLDDLTAQDTLRILSAGRIKNDARAFYRGEKIRTHLLFHEGLAINGEATFYACSSLETVKFENLRPAAYCFSLCPKLRSIQGHGISYGMKTQNCGSTTFGGCTALREVRLILNGGTVDLHWSPNIDLDSWQGMIAHAANTQPQTVIVHPAIYARMTDADAYPDWAQLIEDAAARQITFATVES